MIRPTSSHPLTCTYCGSDQKLTSDHVPPKNLFPKPLPDNMLTVPACEKCNKGFERDDNYFRMALTLSEHSKGHPDRDKILPKVLAGLNRPQASGFRNAVMQSSSLRQRFTPAGLYLGPRHALIINGERMNQTARRITKGLFYLCKGYRLPENHEVNVLPVSRFAEMDRIHPEMGLAHREFVMMLSEQPVSQVGKVFAYRWAQSPNGVSQTMWLLYFFGRLEFFTSTVAVSARTGNLAEEIDKIRMAEGQLTFNVSDASEGGPAI